MSTIRIKEDQLTYVIASSNVTWVKMLLNNEQLNCIQALKDGDSALIEIEGTKEQADGE